MTERTDHDTTTRPFAEMRDEGLLWHINRVCFHPHGYALAFDFDDETGELLGWQMLGDGSEVWTFTNEADDEEFAKVQRYFAPRPPA